MDEETISCLDGILRESAEVKFKKSLGPVIGLPTFGETDKRPTTAKRLEDGSLLACCGCVLTREYEVAMLELSNKWYETHFAKHDSCMHKTHNHLIQLFIAAVRRRSGVNWHTKRRPLPSDKNYTEWCRESPMQDVRLGLARR
jgi:hypothetical protein